MLEKLTPDEYYDTVLDIDPLYLKNAGIKGVIVDLDNTLVPRNESIAPSKLIDWLQKMKQASLSLVIVSNNSKTRGGEIARELGLPLVAYAKKPWRKAFEKGLNILKSPVSATVVVGDQIFTDVLGGNRMGLHTILVVPLSGKELFVTRIVRQVEKIILNKLEKRMLIPKDERRYGNNGEN